MIPLTPMQQELVDLRKQNEALADELYDLKLKISKRDMAGEEYDQINRIQVRFDLTYTEAKLLSLLVSGRVVSYLFMLENLSHKDCVSDLVKVYKSKIAPRFAPFKISMQWGKGYYLEGESLRVIQQLMAGEDDGKAKDLQLGGNGGVRSGSSVQDGVG